MRERSDPIVVDQNAILQAHRDWRCVQASVWELRYCDVSFGKVVVLRFVGQDEKRKKQRTKPDRSKRFLVRMSGKGTQKRRSDPCAAEMSMERSKGASDLCLKGCTMRQIRTCQ